MWVFVLAAVSGVVEWVRAYLDDRHQFKRVIEHLVDDCAKQLFSDRQKQNRITLFKVTTGWRAFLWSMARLPLFQKLNKWRAAFRLRWAERYLAVYYRPAIVRNRHSTTALRVSDLADECEGMAGLVYEEGFYVVADLPAITRLQVSSVKSMASLTKQDPVRHYAEATKISDLHLLRTFDTFARHFMGVTVRTSNGTPWGVLLIDSEEPKCPFSMPSGGGIIKDQLNNTARIIGKLVN